jgi:hypothetical protein
MDPVSEIFSSSQVSRQREKYARLFKDDPEVTGFLQLIDKINAELHAQHRANSKPSEAILAAQQAKRELDAKLSFLKSMIKQAEAAMANAPEGPEGDIARQKLVFWETQLSQTRF